MATKGITVRISFRYRWWLGAYLFGLKTCSLITGMEPDMVKAQKWIMRGIKVNISEQGTSDCIDQAGRL